MKSQVPPDPLRRHPGRPRRLGDVRERAAADSADRVVEHQAWYHGGWGSEDLGGGFSGTPSAVISGDRTDVYATDADGYIRHRSHGLGGSWTGWVAVTTASGSRARAKAGTGVAAVHGNGHDRLFYIAPGENVEETYYDGGWQS